MIVDFLEVRMQNFDGSIFKALKEQVADAHFYWRVSARHRKSKLWMRNFTEEYLQGMENMECRCKICGGSILKL